MSYFVMSVLNDNYTLQSLLKNFYLSQDKIKSLNYEQKIFVNGLNCNLDMKLKKGDIICIDTTNYDQNDFLPSSYELDILYEDDYLLVINKPAKCIIHPDNITKENTLGNYVLDYYLKNDLNYKVRHLHRLDFDTTGCIVYCKDIVTHAAMTRMLEDGRFIRKYLAIVIGNLKDKKGIINKNIGKDRHINGKMIVSKSGKAAKTTYQVLKEKKGYTLLELKLDTGRTHQIRVHMASLNHPLIGDSLYGSNVKAKRVFLHSYYVEFIHPITQKKILVKTNLPEDMNNFWNKI